MAEKVEIKNRLRGLLDPVVALLSYLGITPLWVTIFGILLSFLGAFLVAGGRLRAGGLTLLFSGLCDVLDGSLARSEEKVSTFGAFLDSTGDRLTELAYFIALVFYFAAQDPINKVMIFFVLAALSGSLLTSYARARAEGLGLECTVGFLERPERVVMLLVGLMLGRFVLSVVLVFLAILSIFTFIQRVLHVRKLTREDA
ncbi:MAG: CDP-alcohol phosphatidyltransferase family protein [Candidatus Krumholzibacteriota bacterium]|nr:CDP-alcohol phosphatidyltransferase family protein [Candidatus Krumholzibacteriota bacterium]